MLVMKNVSYNPNYNKIVTKIEAEDACLTELFAHFVIFTKQMGYHMNSWDRVFENVAKECDKNYPIDLWALDTIFEYSDNKIS